MVIWLMYFRSLLASTRTSFIDRLCRMGVCTFHHNVWYAFGFAPVRRIRGHCFWLWESGVRWRRGSREEEAL